MTQLGKIVMTEAEMDLAKRRRTQQMKLLNDAIAQVGTAPFNDLGFYQLRQRLKNFEENLAAAKAAHNAVCDLEDDDDARQGYSDQYVAFEERCMDAMATIEQKIVDKAPMIPNTNAAPPTQADQPPPAVNQQPALRVLMPYQPELVPDTWGPFHGKHMDWYDWKAKFVLAVHGVDRMPIKNKLQHLLNALKEDALGTVSKHDLIEANYEQIWQTLVDTYEKRYPTACAYLSKFFAMKKLDFRVTPADLQRMVNTTNEITRQMRQLNYPVQHWNMVVVYALEARLNEYYANEWIKKRGDNEDPTVEDMTKFLSHSATLLANQGLSYKPLAITVTNERATLSAATQSQRGQPSSTAKKFPCDFCGSHAHQSAICPKYIDEPLHVRQRMISDNRMCVNCIKHGHFKHQCYSLNACDEPSCNKARHHPSLCPFKQHREEKYRVALAQYDERQRKEQHAKMEEPEFYKSRYHGPRGRAKMAPWEATRDRSRDSS